MPLVARKQEQEKDEEEERQAKAEAIAQQALAKTIRRRDTAKGLVDPSALETQIQDDLENEAPHATHEERNDQAEASDEEDEKKRIKGTYKDWILRAMASNPNGNFPLNPTH